MEWSMPSDSGYLLKSLTFSSPFSSKSRQGTCGFRESQATYLPLELPPRGAALVSRLFPRRGFLMVWLYFHKGWLMKLNQ